jgi:peptide/nickel transport system substrate-binding protein
LNRLFDRKTRADAIFVVSSNELLDADKSFSAYYKAGGIGSSNTDAELARLIDGARTETDVEKRASLYHQAVQRAFDQAYFVWLLNIEDIYGMSKRLDWAARVDAKMLVKEMRVIDSQG